MIKQLEGVTPNYRQHTLISMNALVDIDIGLIKLIREQYLDPSVFNVELLSSASIIDVINTTYMRTDQNPLYDFASITDKKTLDEYYVEFFTTVYNDIYDRSTYTDILHLIDLFIDTNEMDVSILYYNDYALSQFKKDQENGVLSPDVEFVNAKTARTKDLDNFDQFYFRSIYELDKLQLSDLKRSKTFYISSFRPNYYPENLQLRKTEALNALTTSKLYHSFAIFDIYNSSIFHKKEEGESK